MVHSDTLKIAVIGGGNIGTQFACICASKGFLVNIHTSRPEAYDGELEIIDENDRLTVGKLDLITSDIGRAIDGCDVIFVTHPAFMLKETAHQMLPYVHAGTKIVIIPGTGGAELSFQPCIKAGAVLYGLQRSPSVARLEKYGKRVRCEGLRDQLHIASFPNLNSEWMQNLLEYLFEIPCKILSNYLCVTLVPSNPILHTTRLCTLFGDYQDGRVYDRNPLFYGEWSDVSSELLLSCDAELQTMCAAMQKLDLTDVRSLKLHYESDTVDKMTKKIRSIKSLHNLGSPMKQTEGGWIPDFQSRYFTADFPFGLSIIESLAEVLNIDVPNIKKTMTWYRNVTGDMSGLRVQDYDIRTLEDIYAMYS